MGVSSDSITTKLQVRRPGVQFPTGTVMTLFFTTASRPALGPTQPTKWVVPRSGMRGAVPLLPQYIFVTWCLFKQCIRFRGVVLS
jgi:hypothetical protein